jgi:hypothetical protein
MRYFRLPLGYKYFGQHLILSFFFCLYIESFGVKQNCKTFNLHKTFWHKQIRCCDLGISPLHRKSEFVRLLYCKRFKEKGRHLFAAFGFGSSVKLSKLQSWKEKSEVLKKYLKGFTNLRVIKSLLQTRGWKKSCFSLYNNYATIVVRNIFNFCKAITYCFLIFYILVLLSSKL